MKVIWTEQALYDWQVIADYIFDRFGLNALIDFHEETRAQQTGIVRFPDGGAPLSSKRRQRCEFRYVPINKLSKIIYHVDGETIYVDVFWDVRQDPKRLAKRLANF